MTATSAICDCGPSSSTPVVVRLARIAHAYALFIATADRGEVEALEEVAREAIDEDAVHSWVLAWMSRRESALVEPHHLVQRCTEKPVAGSAATSAAHRDNSNRGDAK